MPRYIDADALKESLKELKAEGNNLKYVQGLQDAIDGYFPQIIDDEPTADVQPVKHEQRIDYEKLICIFSTLCDYMVDNGRCDVFCPYAKIKDKDDECEAWRTIQKIRREEETNANF